MIKIDGVFEGGGAKGTAYAGVLETLQEKGIWFERVAGTSAGAITAALIAAGYQARCDNEDELKTLPEYSDHFDCLRGLIYNTDFNTFKDKPRFGTLNLIKNSGFYKGDVFRNWLDEKIAAKVKPQATFADMPLDLSVVASDISNERYLIFNKYTTPDLKVSEAVRMSMSIPFFFSVYKWQGLGHYAKDGEMRVVDGGLLSNYPVWLFDSDNEFLPNSESDKKRPTIGFYLIEKPDPELDAEPTPVEEGTHRRGGSGVESKGFSPFAFIKKLPVVQDVGHILNTLLSASDKRYIKKAKWANTVPVFVNDYGVTQFDLTNEQKDDLRYRGQIAVERRLNLILSGYGIELS